MIAFLAGRLMALEVDGLRGAGHGERSPARTNQRTVFRERTWEIRTGMLELRILKLRTASDFSAFLEP